MRVIKLWKRLLRDSPSMEIFMNSLQVGWTWWFLKDPFRLKVWFCDYGLACSGILPHTVWWDWALAADTIAFASFVTMLVLQLPLPHGTASSCCFLTWQDQRAGPYIHIGCNYGSSSLPVSEWGWQIAQFASSEASSLITLLSSRKSRKETQRSCTLKNFPKTKGKTNRGLLRHSLIFAWWLPLVGDLSVTFQNWIWKSLSGCSVNQKSK